jgi:FkbM family methyltransferase
MDEDEVNRGMSPKLMEAASHRIGTMRFGRHSIPGQGRMADAVGKLAGWIGGSRGIASPWPGVRFEADLNDRVQRQMWAGVYEQHVRHCLDVLLQPGDGYIDVGGHIGYHAVAAAHRVGAGGRVAAFEADPAMYERLTRNLDQFPWAQTVHAAVWHSSGTLTFERSSNKHESGWGTLANVRDLGTGEHVDVRAVSLDDWFRDAGAARWKAMKLDAEGSELAVLRGAENTIERFRPFLILEINEIVLKQANFSASAVMKFLTTRGYHMYQLSFRHLERWDLAKHGEFSEALCLPGEREKADLERLVRAGFGRPK